MFEFFLEMTEINTLYAIYAGIILGLSLRYFWLLNKEHFTTSTAYSFYPDEKKINAPLIVLKKYNSHSHLLFNWIIQIVRRKEASAEDIDCSVCF